MACRFKLDQSEKLWKYLYSAQLNRKLCYILLMYLLVSDFSRISQNLSCIYNDRNFVLKRKRSRWLLVSSRFETLPRIHPTIIGCYPYRNTVWKFFKLRGLPVSAKTCRFLGRFISERVLTEKSFWNHIKSTRNQIVFTISRLIWNSKISPKSVGKW